MCFHLDDIIQGLSHKSRKDPDVRQCIFCRLRFSIGKVFPRCSLYHYHGAIFNINRNMEYWLLTDMKWKELMP